MIPPAWKSTSYLPWGSDMQHANKQSACHTHTFLLLSVALGHTFTRTWSQVALVTDKKQKCMQCVLWWEQDKKCSLCWFLSLMCLHSPKASTCLCQSPKAMQHDLSCSRRFPHVHNCPVLSPILSPWALITFKNKLICLIPGSFGLDSLPSHLLLVLFPAFSRLFLFEFVNTAFLLVWDNGVSFWNQCWAIAPSCPTFIPVVVEFKLSRDRAPSVAGMASTPHPSPLLLSRQCQ